MEIYLHIGLPHCGGGNIQLTFDSKRNQLIKKGVLYPRSPGRRNHTRLFLALSDGDRIDPLHIKRGYGSADAREFLYEEVVTKLSAEITKNAPDKLILSADQLASGFSTPTELLRLKEFLNGFSTDIRIVAHVDEQARVLVRNYTKQILEGRTASLDQEIAAAGAQDWHSACIRPHDMSDPILHRMPAVRDAPFWLDYEQLVARWEAAFSAGSVTLRAYDRAFYDNEGLINEVRATFDLPGNIGKTEAARAAPLAAAAFLSRSRALNQMLDQVLAAGYVIPGSLQRRMNDQVMVGGPPIDPGSLGEISARFADGNARLLKRFKDLSRACLTPTDAARKTAQEHSGWKEADPLHGFRASQYMSVFMEQIAKATRADKKEREEIAKANADGSIPPPSELLNRKALMHYTRLKGGPFAPHNNARGIDEQEVLPEFDIVPRRELPEGNSGVVIVACMKNEAPYIVEWVAFHRSIGVDNFLIYTNGCEDGTDEILDRLQEMGIVQHRDNDNWEGNSPQQHALNNSLDEPLMQNAEWIIHIDVDEFINVRTGNGTLQACFDKVPHATSFAMTWRMFGHNGVRKFADLPVIEQFDGCSPNHCPRPHTVWGLKTMYKNNGAYEKLSCHRPTKLIPGKAPIVSWVNGSGQSMGDGFKERGWRSNVKNVGYDIVQLNHYALRSAEGFLVKRQRGRALHVDQSIGLSYWVRMDWSENKDVTIQRNLGRLRHEMISLLEDEKLEAFHNAGVAWHQAKIEELHKIADFEELYQSATAMKLTELERAAFALALDMEA